MKFHPILFSTPMVQAIGDGTKTQTRRVINFQPDYFLNCVQGKALPVVSDETKTYFSAVKDGETIINIKPKYNIGDVLWVRETFGQILSYDKFCYKADVCSPEVDKPALGWKPSIFMPKPAARYFLKIKSIKVERLQQINEADAKAEGAKDTLKFSELKCLKDLGNWIIPRPFSQYQFGFLSIWCNINGPENWLSNPFVWVYEFEKIEKPDNFTQADN